jgi:uncharacterized protein YecT (DUF1311 family)
MKKLGGRRTRMIVEASRVVFFILGAFFLLLTAGNIHAASFDCNRATTLVEKLICADEALSQLDETLSWTYRKVLRSAPDPERIKREQTKWLRVVRDKCKDSACLEKEYRNRLAVLEQPLEAPAELKRLLSAGEVVYDFRKADLNGDGLSDYIFIVTDCDGVNPECDDRTLKIAIRSSDGRLKIVKSNDRIILGKEEGGVFGNPYMGMEAGNKWFSVSHHGGSTSTFDYEYRFNYSRKDKTWQLVLVREGWSSFDPDTSDLVTVEHVYQPPKDYGKIDIADFDPHNYRESDK